MICLPDRCLEPLEPGCVGGVGNDLGVGKTCTTAGGECDTLVCGLDMAPPGPPFCVILNCTVDNDCGQGAICADVGEEFKVCLPESCFGP